MVIIKDIKGYNGDYKITETGEIWSFKYKTPRKLSYWVGKTSPYLQVGLTKNGVTRKFLVHRLVAMTYLENPNNFEIVHHKDSNVLNNDVDNLEWTTQRANVHHSYKSSGVSATRNSLKVRLFQGEKFIGEFNSQKEACKVASELGCSFTSLEKNKKYGEFRLEKV